MEFDSIQVGARDVETAARACELLLGIVPVRLPRGSRRFQLRCGAVEIDADGAGLQGIRFIREPDDPDDWPKTPADSHGLRVRLGLRREDAQPAGSTSQLVEGIDHIVVHTPDLERAIALWRDRLGLKLALDRSFPNRGLRMLFFRSGGVTLEFVSSVGASPDRSGPDRLYGVAYRVPDLRACHQRLIAAGLELSEVRPGHEGGTLVSTVRSGTEGVPTLLIQRGTSAA